IHAMRCCRPEITTTNGAPGSFHRRRPCTEPFHCLIEIWRWLVSLSLVNYATTKTSQSSVGRKHPPYRHETARKKADTWLPGSLPPRRSCGDEDVQRQRIWRKASRSTRCAKVQAVDAAPFAAEKVAGWIAPSHPECIFRYAFQHSKNPGAKSSGLADVHPSITAGAKKTPLSISHLLGVTSSETTPQ